MKRCVDIDASPKEVAGSLFDMHTGEIAEVFTEWDRLIREKQKQDRNNGNINFWNNLGDCLIWVSNEVEDSPDLLDVFRAAYSSSLSKLGIVDFEKHYKP